LGNEKDGSVNNHPVKYNDIHMPKNTAVGVIVGVFSLLFGFALIWHIWWLVAVGVVATIVTVIVRSYDDSTDYYVPAAEVERIENLHIQEKKAYQDVNHV